MNDTNYDGVKRNTDMDLVNALKTTSAPKEHPIQEAAVEEWEEVQTPMESTEYHEEPQMSAIDRAIAAKKREQSGMLDDEKAAAEESQPIRPSYDSDEARKDFSDKIEELEEDDKKASSVVAIRRPNNPGEYAKMISEIDAVTFDRDGQAIVPEGAEFIVAKTPEVIEEMERIKAREAANTDETDNVVEEGPVDITTAKQEYKNNIVQILIDKTGMGANIHFDDEESKAIEVADVIRLCEVEDQDLRVVDVERMEDDGTPFMQAIEARQLSVSKVPMTFPGSGFKAQMTGLSWGEYADITLDTDSDDAEDFLNFDKLYRRYSTIYNNMKNISVGPFKDFDDFLHKFAHDDSPLAVYGLVLATQPDIDSLYMNCTTAGCKKRFLYKYEPRGVIDLDTASVEMLEALDRISEAGPDLRYELFKNSRVNKFRRIKLPVSGYLVDIGLASAWDYLYQILPIVQEYAAIEDTMSDTDPRKRIPAMLFGVRNIFIPLKTGGHARASKARDVADAILSLPSQDAAILEAAVRAYRGQYQVGFSLKNIECPYCHTKTEAIPIDIDVLVFQIQLRQLNTRVAVKNFPIF